MKNSVLEAVKTHFRPEFINRLDDLVVFQGLRKGQIKQIAEIQLRRLQARLADRQLKLHVSDEALTHISDVGFDPVYGARPLKRAIQQELENPLAQKILSGEFKPNDEIEVSMHDYQLVFQTKLHLDPDIDLSKAIA